jgi:hypothetical protein
MEWTGCLLLFGLVFATIFCFSLPLCILDTSWLSPLGLDFEYSKGRTMRHGLVTFATLSGLHFGCLLSIGVGQFLLASFPRCGGWTVLLASAAGAIVMLANFVCGLSGLDPAFAFSSEPDFVRGVVPDCPTMRDSVCQGGGWAEFPNNSCVLETPRWNCNGTTFVVCERGKCTLNCSSGTDCFRCKMSDCSVSAMFAWLRALPVMNVIGIVMVGAAVWRVARFVRAVKLMKADPEQLDSFVAEVLAVVVKTECQTHYTELSSSRDQ